MKKLIFLFIMFFICQIAFSSVSIQVYGPDGETPFGFQDIMVGQKLTLTITSDSNDPNDPNDPNDLWSGAFYIEGDDRDLGRLDAINSDPNTRDCDESHYSAAGDYAVVFKWVDSVIWGYDMYASDVNSLPGKWFTIDYYAEQPGDCQVDFYDYNTSWDDPNLSFNFTHQPSCDFNQDGNVNFTDFSQLSSYWLIEDCNDVNDCVAIDLNSDGIIDHNDLTMFAEFWLWGGSISESEPNTAPLPGPTPDPNYIYSIIDVNGLDEITLEVDETVTLYIYLETINEDDLRSLDVEVQISDPNLGEIDNIAYPNGTAEILASPRATMFDYWSPGTEQQEGIRFWLLTFSLDTPIDDGHMASFVYTANNAGDVTLNLANIVSTYFDNEVTSPTLESILIHQTSSQQQQSSSSQSMMMSGPALETETLDMSETIDLLEMIRQENKDFRKSMNQSKWNQFIDALSNM